MLPLFQQGQHTNDDVPIPFSELNRLFCVRQQDPDVVACINAIFTFLNIDAISLHNKEKGLFAKYNERVTSNYHIPFIRDALSMFITCGFCPYFISEVEVKIKDDPHMQETQRAIKQSTKVKETTILTVPMAGTYNTRLVRNKKTHRYFTPLAGLNALLGVKRQLYEMTKN
jgi:hypothetical protein